MDDEDKKVKCPKCGSKEYYCHTGFAWSAVNKCDDCGYEEGVYD